MKSSFLLILTITICCLLIQQTLCQTCKIGTLYNQSPKQCTDCSTCTGASPTCATKSEDSQVATGLLLLTGDCRAITTEQFCGRFDPKNQQYINSDGSFRICKAKCEKKKSTCNDVIDCSNNPTTDCWNHSNTMVLSMGAFILMIVSILLF